MTSWTVGAGLGSLDFVATGLEGTDVGGADVFGAVVPEPDEHAVRATARANPSSNLWLVFILLLLPSIRPGCVPVVVSRRDLWIDVERLDDVPREIEVGSRRLRVREDHRDESGAIDIEDVQVPAVARALRVEARP
jgi:hypothetical protein